MSILRGPVNWGMGSDRDGNRTFRITWLIEAENDYGTPLIDDPSIIYNTPGLPLVGSAWSDLTFIKGGDDWAFCSPEMDIEPHDTKPGEIPQFYLLTNIFSTVPLKRCQDQSITNPLDEPPDLSGSWVDKRIIPYQDRDGLSYRSSTGEPLFGAETEIDDSDWELNIEFNSINLPLDLVNSLRHHLNDSVLWDLPAETVKFSKYSFSRRLYGKCSFYYRNNMGFRIRADWKQYLADKGRMELISGGDPAEPADWIVAKDVFGENKPMLRLDTSGKPIVGDSQTPNVIIRKPYYTGNLLLLGVPASL